MKTTKMANGIMVAAILGLLAASVNGQTIALPVAQDSFIDGSAQTANYGTNALLRVAHNSSTTYAGARPYLLFDASVYGTTNIDRVESLQFYLNFDNRARSVSFWLLTGTNTGTGVNVDDWVETEINYLNAPCNNNGTTISRDFVPYEGENPIFLGAYQQVAGIPQPSFFPLIEGSYEETELLKALNTGDRKATIGMRWNSSQTEARGIYSREDDQGRTTQLNIVLGAPAETPVSFVKEPVSVTVTGGPFATDGNGVAYKYARFSTAVFGSLPISYQWLTNGVAVDGATNRTLTLAVNSPDLDGAQVSVQVDNDYTEDPGITSSNAVLTLMTPPTPDGTLVAQTDLCYWDNNLIYNSAFAYSGAIPVGLLGQGGLTLNAANRSYIQFTLGTNRVSHATLRLFQYWTGTGTKPPLADVGIWGSTNTLTLPEVPLGVSEVSTNAAYTAPDNTNFVGPLVERVGPDYGWYDWDVTEFYNMHLGKQLVVRVGGQTLAGSDPVMFEDSENTAHINSTGVTMPAGGPRIEYVLGGPMILSAAVMGSQVVLSGDAPANASQGFNVLSSTNVTAPLNTWTSAGTGTFGAGNGNFNVSVPFDSNESQRFYILQAQP